jgi:hypothetical protein
VLGPAVALLLPFIRLAKREAKEKLDEAAEN